MNNASAKNLFTKLLNPVGITINGKEPWDPQVHNEKLYSRVIHDGILGLGEAYMDEWWDCQELDSFFYKALRGGVDANVNIPTHFKLKILLSKFLNFQSKQRSRQVARQHYDLGNDLFSIMLDKRMIYSCGYWKNAHTLDEAQEAKLDLICQKLQLKPGLRLLDIGCGWGGLAKFAAEKYGVNVVGVTISQQQYDFAKEYCAGLPIDIRLKDYRDINEKFDRIVSVGMFEHVGHKNYLVYMKTIKQALNKDGIFLLHTIGINEYYPMANEWINTYIFPNGALPTIAQIGKSAEKKFIMEDWHNFGAYYDKTLMAWYQHFVNGWDKLKATYDKRFYRMWTFYLLACAGGFRARSMELWQVVFSDKGMIGGYISPR